VQPPPPKKLKATYDLAFSPDGSLLSTIGRDVWLWSVPDFRKVWKVKPLAHPSVPAFSPDGKRLAIKSTTGDIAFLETATGAVTARGKKTEFGSSGGLHFADDGQHLLDCTSHGSHIVRTLDGTIVFLEEFYPDMAMEILRHPDGTFWFRQQRRSGHEELARSRLLGRGFPLQENIYQTLVLPTEHCDGAAFHPAGNILALLSSWKLIERLTLYEFPTLRELQHVPAPGERKHFRSVAFSPCGTLLAACTNEQAILYRTSDLAPLRTYDVEYCCAVLFAPQHPLLVIGSWTAGEVHDIRDLLE
jgi:WD40 repeat protein